MTGLLHAEQAVVNGERSKLEKDLEYFHHFGVGDDFDRGVADYLRQWDETNVKPAIEDVRSWMINVRDEILYPLANGADWLSDSADGLGQSLPTILDRLDKIIEVSQCPKL